MAVVIAPETDYAKELAKWEQPNRQYVEFPKNLCRATRTDRGPVEVTAWVVAHDADDEQRWYGKGYHPSQQAALDAFHAEDREMARLAAERAHDERSMSPKAQAEAAAVDAATDQHVPVIPPTPIRPKR